MEKINYQEATEQWGLWEIGIPGPSEGNPFTEQTVKATISGKNEIKEIYGFYDGEGRYKVRFMPSFQGDYEFQITSSFGTEESGKFHVTEPSEGNHGPVRVAGTWHFAYEDGMPYYSVGTTCLCGNCSRMSGSGRRWNLWKLPDSTRSGFVFSRNIILIISKIREVFRMRVHRWIPAY